MLNMTEGNLLELEQIDGKFRTMIHQIRKLKITLYETGIRETENWDGLSENADPAAFLFELPELYLQHDRLWRLWTRKGNDKNHFGLSFIYFRNTTDRVPVLAESKHCEDYLKILLLRYPDKFTYYIEVHDEVADAEIFPFLIQVYVENAAKQALMAEWKMLISVTGISWGQGRWKYVNILSRIRERDFRTKYYVNYKMDKHFWQWKTYRYLELYEAVSVLLWGSGRDPFQQ